MKIKKEQLLIILAFIGLILSLILLWVDMNAKAGIANTACNITSYINCDKIAQSSFAHVFGVPTSLLGVFFFFFIALFGILTKNSVIFMQISFWLFAFASLASLFLLFVSLFHIQALCIFCTGTYLVNFIALYLLKDYYKPSFSDILARKNIETILIALLFSLALAVAGYFVFQPAQNKSALRSKNLIQTYLSSQPYSLNLSLSPYTGSNNPKVEIVVYSDFFCSHCKHFMIVLDQLLKIPKYQASVRVYYKTYPLDHRTCTEKAEIKKLSRNCKLSLISFELLKKGLFWEFEAKIRENPLFNLEEGLKTADELNRNPLDMAQVHKNNIKHVLQNIEEAAAFKIMSTPTWFINGRRFEGSYELPDLILLLDYLMEEKQS